MAEGVGFEPTDGVNRQTISSRSRYDHFDTSPYKSCFMLPLASWRGREKGSHVVYTQKWDASTEISWGRGAKLLPNCHNFV